MGFTLVISRNVVMINLFPPYSQMYTLEEAAGKAKYGDKFNTAEYYVYKHLNGAGTTDCDHWHDGAGE